MNGIEIKRRIEIIKIERRMIKILNEIGIEREMGIGRIDLEDLGMKVVGEED